MPVPVVSVGALTAGGAGKTPVSAWLATALGPGAVVVARGFRRDPGDDVRRSGDAAALGDELAMLSRRGLAVASCPDRARAIEVLDAGAVAILDDAFVHRRVARDLEIVVLDARWPTGGGLIPVGTARVPIAWLRRAEVVWVNHGPLAVDLRRWLAPGAVVVEARFRPTGWIRDGVVHPLTVLSPQPALLLAGIARPEAFAATLRGLGWRSLEPVARPDHHRFAPGELDALVSRAAGRPILTTEKDAARLPVDAPVWALRVDAEILSGEAALRARLGALCAGAARVHGSA